LKLDSTAMVDGSNYRIRIAFDPTKVPTAGDYSGAVVIETDEGRKVEVPVKMKVIDK
jgi:Rib/alpha/Esp surface antigen-like repeat protein